MYLDNVWRNLPSESIVGQVFEGDLMSRKIEKILTTLYKVTS